MTRAALCLALVLVAAPLIPSGAPRPQMSGPPPSKLTILRILFDAAREFHLDPGLVLSVAIAESSLNPDTKSFRWVRVDPVKDRNRWDFEPGMLYRRETVARGLMQISVQYQDELVAKYLGWCPRNFDWANPVHSAKLGCAYLSALIKRSGTWGGVASYNCGPGRFDQLAKGRPLPAETVEYIRRVLG